jgi:hypothetical protein
MGLKSIFRKNALKAKDKQRIKNFINLDDLKRVGILFERDNDTTAANTAKLAKFLFDQGIQIDVLAYVNLKKPTEELESKKGLKLFYKRDLNWFGKPKSEEVVSFIKQKFDLLIKADFSKSYPLAYICTQSNASLVAGPKDDLVSSYDFILETHKSDQREYHQALLHYLSVINKK